MADEKKKDAVEKAEKKAKATKAAKADKANKPKKPNIFVRAGKAIARFFKDFRGETKKITWPDAKTVLKNTGIVIAVILIIGIGVWIVDFALSGGLSLIEGLAQEPETTAAITEPVTDAVTQAATEASSTAQAGAIRLFGMLG
ncbi:MAG TPA: preprotein translocase subunit SecE [Candidatus Fimivicinus intestinavium]|nr:preprotein translocase subunit SecE [Candidatus Fimivicinus intestinavium]